MDLIEDGFAKDWRLVLNGTSGENGPGWRLLKSMLALNKEDLDDILPGNDSKRGEARGFIDALLGEARDLKPNSTADAVAPAMNRLWKLMEPELDTALADRIEEFTPRAEAGSAEHLYYMGTFAERGIGELKGMEAAADYYRKAADGGDGRAMVRLAELHRTGRGVPRDEAQSQAWKKKAAEARAAPAR